MCQKGLGKTQGFILTLCKNKKKGARIVKLVILLLTNYMMYQIRRDSYHFTMLNLYG